MNRYFSVFLILALPLFGSDDYPDELKQPKGDYKLGEIEIVSDPSKIDEIQQRYYERLRDSGVAADRASKWAKVGEIARDRYYMFVRDAVIFPSGATGLYDRIISEARGGSAILPLFSNGDVGLVVQFRHATRTWELELPRGGTHGDEAPLETAKRELTEETGLESRDWKLLGSVNPDSGILQTKVSVLAARNVEEKKAAPEESEAIDGVIRLSKAALNKALKEGSIEIDIKGVKRTVYVRDPFLTYALYLNGLQ